MAIGQTFILSLAVLLCMNVVAQRNEHVEFSTEINNQGESIESYNIIKTDTFFFEISNYTFINGKYALSGIRAWSYEDFEIFKNGSNLKKSYFGEKDSLTIIYREDSSFAIFYGSGVRGGVKSFTNILDSGTITQKAIPDYNREERSCACLHVMNTNYLIKDEVQYFNMEYSGKRFKDLRLKSNDIELNQKSWSSYTAIPNRLDTIEIIITDSGGDSLYSEIFSVIESDLQDYQDLKVPNQFTCDNISVKHAKWISRSKNQDIMVRYRNFDPSKFSYMVDNGELISDLNNILEIKWGAKNIGVVSVFYDGELLIKQDFYLVK